MDLREAIRETEEGPYTSEQKAQYLLEWNAFKHPWAVSFKDDLPSILHDHIENSKKRVLDFADEDVHPHQKKIRRAFAEHKAAYWDSKIVPDVSQLDLIRRLTIHFRKSWQGSFWTGTQEEIRQQRERIWQEMYDKQKPWLIQESSLEEKSV